MTVRTDPPPSRSEAASLTAFLDLQRETVLLKCAGLSAAQPAQPLPPSSLTLGGLLNHLALVEDTWFRERFLGLDNVPPWDAVDRDGDPDWEFRTAAAPTPTSCASERRPSFDQKCRTPPLACGYVDRLGAAPLVGR